MATDPEKDAGSSIPRKDVFRDAPDFEVADAFGVTLALRFRNFMIRHLELVFVLLIAILVCAIFFILP